MSFIVFPLDLNSSAAMSSSCPQILDGVLQFLGLKARGSQAQTDASEDKDGAKDFISDMAFMWAGSDTNGACEIAAGSQIHSWLDSPFCWILFVRN